MGSKNTKEDEEGFPELYAAIYCRVSTEEQANKGISLHDQEERCLEKVKELGYIVKPEHIFRDEGITGTSMEKRPAMMNLLALVSGPKYQRLNEGNISVIISSNMDRISRDHLDYLLFKKLVEKHSIRYLSVEQDYIGGDGKDDIMTDMLEKMISIFNELMVKITAKKTSHAMERKVLDGWLP
ncbi:MAG: resolvase protein [uncultured bacterium]|nr:MAG: resolvase protein [uncultured bacterium]